MNWKLVVVGGIVFYVVTFAVSMGTGPLVHEGLLKADYKAHASHWRPELNQDPPDMAALMPRWVTTGVLTSFVIAWLFGALRGAWDGAGWRRGLLFGVVLSVVNCLYCAGWSGVFNLPDKIWAVWGLESFAYNLPGGAVLGFVADKLRA